MANCISLAFPVQILEGNARKVKSVRFERLNQDDTKLETKAVARLMPRIMKTKWRDVDYSNRLDHEEIPYQKRLEGVISDSHITAERVADDHDNSNKQKLQ